MFDFFGFGSTGSADIPLVFHRLPCQASHGSHHRWREKARGWTWSVQRLQTILHTKMYSNQKWKLPQLAVPFLTNPRSQEKILEFGHLELSSNFLGCFGSVHPILSWCGKAYARSIELESRSISPPWWTKKPKWTAWGDGFLDGESLIFLLECSVIKMHKVNNKVIWYDSDITVICDTIV